jgi:formylglycine-generating enzyme
MVVASPCFMSRPKDTSITREMVWIPGGAFLMGSDEHYPEERPVHRVAVDGFFIDVGPVTNGEFERFVDATGHVTFAERAPDPRHYPDADPALLLPGSAVFFKPTRPVDICDCTMWWQHVPGANWRHPEGPESGIEGRSDHPVVHVAYEDAELYARWAKKVLPTEAEWEMAARGGLERAVYPWGDELSPNGTMMANTWQGEFPWQNLAIDGYEGTSPVGEFPANGYGLFDMAGNVWEWTADWFTPTHAPQRPCCIPRNPRGGTLIASRDPASNALTPRKVLKGGSFLCSPNYCLRYRPAARIPEPIDTTTCHVGFRCIARTERRRPIWATGKIVQIEVDLKPDFAGDELQQSEETFHKAMLRQ